MTEQTERSDRPEYISRRGFVSLAGLTGVGIVAPKWAMAEQRAGSGSAKSTAPPHEEEDVAPPEDLMREHGVLKRVLLIYDEAIRRIDAKQPLSPDPIKNSAQIIRSFIEDYHEKLEEDYLFPRFEKAGKLADLTSVLRTQHQAGRRLTDQITQLATAASLKDVSSAARLREAMRQFNRMYAPHEAREDTVLFPALRTIVSKNEFAALGEEFEKKEHQLFGEDGFEKMVERVASIEKALGIYDLAQFTPQAIRRRLTMEQQATRVDAPSSIKAVHGVRYQVKDVARAVAFYTQRLGFTLKHQQLPAFANVSLGDADVLLSGPGASGSRPMPNGDRQTPGGWNRVVLRVVDLPACIASLKQAGVTFRNEMEVGPGGRQIQIEDPDGNPLELFEPASRS